MLDIASEMIWKSVGLSSGELEIDLEKQIFNTRLDLYQIPFVENVSIGHNRCFEKRSCSEQRLTSPHVVASLLVAWPVGFLAFTTTVGDIELVSVVVARSVFASAASQGCVRAAVGAAHHDEGRYV